MRPTPEPGQVVERRSNGRRYVVEQIQASWVTLRAVGGDGKRRSLTHVMAENMEKKFRAIE